MTAEGIWTRDIPNGSQTQYIGMNIYGESHTWQKINSMEESPSWKAKNSSGSQEIPHVLRNPKLITKIRRVCHWSLLEPDESGPHLPTLFP